MTLKVLDTNILLLDAYNLINLGKDGSFIVIPSTVIDEIDSKKSGTSEIAFQARQFGRLLSKATVVKKEVDGILFKLELKLEDTSIFIIDPISYPSYKDTEPSIVRDRQIIHAASLIARRYAQNITTFISNDVMCRIRAQAEGLTTSDLKVVDNVDMSFMAKVEVPYEVFAKLHNMPILEADPAYEIYKYNYIFIEPESGQTKLATVTNGFIQVLGKETEKELRAQDLSPINSGQLFLSKAIQDRLVDIVVCEAKAGSGKTAVALSNAIKLVKAGAFQSIHYIRASIDDVDKVEEIGFLSGNDDKVAVYLHPLEDTLDLIIRNRYKDSKTKGAELEDKIAEGIEKLRETCHIQAMIGLGMRGRTFNNTVAIIDEAQGMSKASLQKVITRFGKNCKIIIIGSNNQIDNPYLNKYTNGLSTLLDACTKNHDTVRLHAVSLPKVVRGPIAEFAENLFSERK